jgi:hypothetical protein
MAASHKMHQSKDVQRAMWVVAPHLFAPPGRDKHDVYDMSGVASEMLAGSLAKSLDVNSGFGGGGGSCTEPGPTTIDLIEDNAQLRAENKTLEKLNVELQRRLNDLLRQDSSTIEGRAAGDDVNEVAGNAASDASSADDSTEKKKKSLYNYIIERILALRMWLVSMYRQYILRDPSKSSTRHEVEEV